jgi:tRNA(Ile)-lysidine synthase
MKWRGPSPSNPKVSLVRPLLDQPKAALRQWAATMKVPFREDASNSDLDIQRNRIRHELLPLLRRHYQPALGRTISRLMDIIGEEAAFAAEQARQWIADTSSTDAGRRVATPLAELPPALQRRCIQLQLLAQGVEPDYELVEQLRAAPDRAVTVGQTPSADIISISRDVRGLVSVSEAKPVLFKSDALEQHLRGGAGEVLFDGLRLDWKIIQGGKRPRFGQPGREFFDADRVGTPVVLRHWRPGDRFQPIGMPALVKLQDLFTNEKILPKRRHELIMAATAQGAVFWVEGLRISERFKLTQSTKRRLRWSWRRL